MAKHDGVGGAITIVFVALALFVGVLWLIAPPAGVAEGQESGEEDEDEDAKKKDEDPLCSDPRYWDIPECWTPTPKPPTATPVPPTPTPVPPTPTPVPPPTSTPVPPTPTPTPRPPDVYATISRSDDDLTVSFGWTAPQSESTEWWSVTLLRSATQNGTYTSYRSTTRSSPGSVSFNNVTRDKWYMASVTGCDDDNVCASVNTGKREVPPPPPTPTPVPPTPTPTPRPPDVYATISRSDDDLTVGFGWTVPQSQSTEWWSVALLRSATQDGTYTSYRSTTRPNPGSVSFNNVTRDKWYMASVTGCDDDDVCASVNSSKLEVPPPPPTPTPTPTPTPSGSLSAPVTISQFATTSVTASNLSPAGTSFKIAYPDKVREGTTCGGGGGTKLSGTTLYTITFNAMTSFVFKGCNLGLHVLKLLESTATGGSGVATTTINVVTPTPTPTPTPTVVPSIRISDAVPGWKSVFVRATSTLPANTAWTTLRLGWRLTSGSCNKKPCDGEVALAPNTDVKVITDSLQEASTYALTATGTIRVSPGETKTYISPKINIATHSKPGLVEFDGLKLSKPLDLSDVSSPVMSVVVVDVGVTSTQDTYDFSVSVPFDTGLQLMANGTSTCDWKNTSDTSTTTLEQKTASGYAYRFFVGRCGRGTGKAKLNISAYAHAGRASFLVDTYTIPIPQPWHQADNTVKYVLRTLPPTATPTSTPAPSPIGDTVTPAQVGTPTPTVVPTPNFPAVVATAAAEWNSVAPNSKAFYCQGSRCGDLNRDDTTLFVDVVTPIPAPSTPVFSPKPLYPCSSHLALGCVDGNQFNKVHSGDLIFYVPFPLYVIRFSGSKGFVPHRLHWTDDPTVSTRGKFKYLPSVVVHELGHAAGLGHSKALSDVMYNSAGSYKLLKVNDWSAMEANYKGHSSHTE